MMTAHTLAKMISKCLPVESMIRRIDLCNHQCAMFEIKDEGIISVPRFVQITATLDGNYKILDLPNKPQWMIDK